MKNKEEIVYTVGEGEDAVEKTIVVRRPTPKNERDAKVVYNQAFGNALANGALLEARLDEYMKEQGIWTERKQKELTDVLKDIAEKEEQLSKGGMSKKEGRELALDIGDLRSKMNRIMTTTSELKQHTAEGQAENAKFDYLCSVCILDEEGNPLFKDVDDYYDHGEEDHVMRAAAILSQFVFALDPDWHKNLPENKFLLKYEFIDEDMNFVDNEGRKTDRFGRLINDDGLLINEDGKVIDVKGNVLPETEEEVTEPLFYDEEEETSD